MSVPKESGFIFALGFVLAIYFAFIFAYILLTGVLGVVYSLFGYILVGVLATVTSVFLYVAARRRQVAAFYIMFTVIGALILTSSTLITAPHTVKESYSYGGFPVVATDNFTRTFASYFNTSDSGPLYRYLFLNFSILRIRVFSTGACLMKLSVSSETGLPGDYTVLLSANLWNMSNYSPSALWADYYWTPSGPYVERIGETYPPSNYIYYYYDRGLSLTFENLENSTITINCQLDTYAPQISGENSVTNRIPIIDSNYAYLGIGFLVAAVMIESGALLRRKRTSSQPTTAGALP